MAVIPPRLNQMLRILLEDGRPVSVDGLAKRLGVSRRTVFRELENVDTVLQKAGLALETKPGEGMVLLGDDAGTTALFELLGKDATLHPQSKRDRQAVLAFLLLDTAELQKLYFFASTLGVSEATVSLDLDTLEESLAPHGLTLERRQGQGVMLAGAEENKRRALAALVGSLENVDSFSKAYGYPSRHVFCGIQKLMREDWLPQLDWMTEDSMEMLGTRLAVMVERTRKHHMLEGTPELAAGLPRQLAEQLCDAMESGFSIRLSAAERSMAGTFIRACRAKQRNPLDINDAAAYSRVQSLAYRMIDSFDANLSHSLKLNEDLVQGLSLHLWSAVVRLKKNVELHSIMQEQIRSDFPEVFEKSRRAAKVLEQELGLAVPDSEVAFIASHFGAALMHIGERSSRRAVLKAGIVCVSGIGVSFMMASQVRQNFRGELDVEVSDWNSPEEWDRFDLLVSSIPLQHTRCPVIMVNPILTPQDLQAIRDAVNRCGTPRADEMPHLLGDLPGRLREASERFLEIAKMLQDFSRITIHADCTFDELAKMAGYRFGSRPESGAQIYQDLVQREQVSSQVIPQLGIVLLHTRTEGADRPVLGLVVPENGCFTGEYFQNAKSCLVMLVPRQSGKDLLEVFGYISGALVEDDVLLGAVQAGDAVVAYTRMEAALLCYLNDYWSGRLRQ